MRLRWWTRSRPRRRAPGRRQYLAHRKRARTVILGRLAHWAGILGLSYGRVAIRNQTTRWGSCSKKGNLNFNYRIAFLPEALLDYVIVHELCHLKEFNHSPSFWSHVGAHIPDYREKKHALRLVPIGEVVTP